MHIRTTTTNIPPSDPPQKQPLPPEKHLLPKTRCPCPPCFSDLLLTTRMIHFSLQVSCMFSRNVTVYGRAYGWCAFIRSYTSTFHSLVSCSQYLGLNQNMYDRENTVVVGTASCTRSIPGFHCSSIAAADIYCEYSQYYCVVFRSSARLLLY